jgi:catechol 2,3-dioxygenase-like lactoylglutathione lyase family enzyme
VLAAAPFIGFIPVRDLAVARGFYESTLGLVVEEETPAGLVIDAAGTMLRITAVPNGTPQPFTVAGWKVSDIADTVARLGAAGIAPLRYEGLEQDDDGVWTAPNGDRIAWFRDPDANVLSLTQFAGAVLDDYWR